MLGELAALGAALSWTVSAVLYRDALEKTEPLSANIIRLASTSVLLIILVLAGGRFCVLLNLSLHAVVLAYISGIIGLGFGDTLYMKSLKLVGVARAVPVTCTYPLFNLIWAAFLLNEKIKASVVIGAAAIVLGIWFLSRRDEKRLSVLEKENLILGVAIALLTAIFWSISITMVNLAVKETVGFEQALAINIIRTAGSGASLLAVALLIKRNPDFRKMQMKTFMSLVSGGMVAIGLGWLLLTYSLTETTEAQAVPISSTTPLFSTLSAMILLHEKVTVENIIGSIAIVTGIFLIFTV